MSTLKLLLPVFHNVEYNEMRNRNRSIDCRFILREIKYIIIFLEGKTHQERWRMRPQEVAWVEDLRERSML